MVSQRQLWRRGSSATFHYRQRIDLRHQALREGCKSGEIIQIIEFSLPERLLARHPVTADSTGAKTNKLVPRMTAFQNRGESNQSKSAAVCGTDRWHRFLKLRLQKRHEHKALGCCKDRRRDRNVRKTKPSVAAGSNNAGRFPAPPATGVPLRYPTVRD